MFFIKRFKYSSNIQIFFNTSCLFSVAGCKVDTFDLKVEAVNTHRDRPLVRRSTTFTRLTVCVLFVKTGFTVITSKHLVACRFSSLG